MFMSSKVNTVQALLGGPAIRVMNLLKKTNLIESVYSSEVEAKLNEKWQNASPKLFKGLGRIKNEYTIKLKPDVQPHAVMKPLNMNLSQDKMKNSFNYSIHIIRHHCIIVPSHNIIYSHQNVAIVNIHWQQTNKVHQLILYTKFSLQTLLPTSNQIHYYHICNIFS